MSTAVHPDLVSPRIEDRLRKGELTDSEVVAFRDFLDRVERDLFRHRVITDNAYTRWFQEGKASDAELRHFVRQFSVFSNQFLVAALFRVINAPTLQQARAAKEILLNELGVIYRRTDGRMAPAATADEESKDREGDPELVSTEGTVDGGTLPVSRGAFRVAAGGRRGTWARLGRHGQAAAWPCLNAQVLRRAPSPLRQRGRPDRRGGQLRRRELGRGRLLAGAGRRLAADQGGPGCPA